ncbi:FAD-dependent monooxygenase [Pelagibacteraceae bacterium]|nr:FAD-dependent monooxygenase [Pelagibacteraceae bacterium]
MKKKIAIIGSGIGGLTAANLFIKNSDFEIIVYEKEEILSLDQGYGIQLATNSISILNKIGFKNIGNNDIFNPLKLNFYSNNNKICDLDLGRFNKDSVKYTTLQRSTLIEFLKDKLFENNFRFGKEVRRVSKIKDKLLINFVDNTNDLVDFIIVSDGVFSNTKSIIENKIIKPRYNGSVAIRTVIKLSEEFNYDNKNISLIMFPNAHVVIYPINKRNDFNLVCIAREKLSQNYDIYSIIKKKILYKNKNLENLFKGDLKLWPVYVTKKPIKSIHDNVFYLGDAFYTFVPALAQGASQSIEAAYELYNLLSDNKKNIQNIYFKKRLKRTNQINKRSKFNYFGFHISNPLLKIFRNKVLKILVKNKNFINSYLGKVYK